MHLLFKCFSFTKCSVYTVVCTPKPVGISIKPVILSKYLPIFFSLIMIEVMVVENMFMLSRDRDMFQMIVILNIFSSKLFLSIKCIFISTTCTSVQSKHMHTVFVF
jgi:hypothetical protein